MIKKIIFILIIISLIPLVYAGQNFTTTKYKITQVTYGSGAGNSSTSNYTFEHMYSSEAQNSSTASYDFYLSTFHMYYSNPPALVILYEPEDGNITTLLKPTFIWNATSDPEGDKLYYHLLIDNNTDFSSPTINVTVDEQVPRTSYTLIEELTVDTIYFWKVRAYDGNDYGPFSTARNFTVNSLIIISLPVSSIDFGELGLDDQKNTTTGDVNPIIIQNDGNIPIDITITGEDMWEVQPNPSTYYQFKIGENESDSYSSATTDFTNINQSRDNIDITNLNYSDSSDAAALHLKIKVPPLEDAGGKSSTITVNAE